MSRNVGGGASVDSHLLSQMQQLQLQHAQLQQRVDSQNSNRQNGGGSHHRKFPYKKHHQRKPGHRDRTGGGAFQHTVGCAEISAVEIDSEYKASSVKGGVPLSICADSGATNVITPDRAAPTDYVPFPVGKRQVRLADKGSAARAEGYGKLTLRSTSTGSLLTITNVLYMPTARRTLVCLGRSMKCGVFWHFDRPDGGSIDVAGKGYWGDIVLGPNDLLFLHAAIVYPLKWHATPRSAAPPPMQITEVSNVDASPLRASW